MPTLNIISELDLSSKEKDIIWKYNVSISSRFYRKINIDLTDCEICQDVGDDIDLFSYVTPFLSAGVPITEIQDIIKERWGGLNLSVDVIENHKLHYTALLPRTIEVRDSAREYQETVDSDLSGDMNERSIIESTIRSLTAQRINLETKGETRTKEYFMVVANLFKFIELKAKIKKDIPDGTSVMLNFADLLKITPPNNDNTAKLSGPDRSGEVSNKQ